MNFEKENFDKLNRLLPRGVSIADEINKLIEERIKDLEIEKNRDASIVVDASPIRLAGYYDDNNNNTLDKYISFPEDKEERVKKLWNKESIDLYDLAHTLDDIQEELSTIRWQRYKIKTPYKTVNMKLIPFIQNAVYGGKKGGQ